MSLASHHLVSDFIQVDPHKSHEVCQEGWAHFIQEERNMLSKQEVAEPDDRGGNGVWHS